MNRLLLILFMLVSAVAFSACADPAAKAPKAVVSNEATPAATFDSTRAEQLPLLATGSQIAFVGSKVTGTEKGSFQQFSGTIELVDGKPEKSRVTVDIQTGSVVTDSSGLSDHLKTADFFDVRLFPKASFVSSEIKPSPEGSGSYQVTGVLDLHGIKKTITFPAKINVTSDAVSVDSEFAINRRDFGITFAGKTNDLIRDNVVLKLAVKAPRGKPVSGSV